MFDIGIVIALAIAIVIVISSVLFAIRYNRLIKHIEAQFPGPRSWPIFGNFLQIGFTPDAHLRCLIKWIQTYNYKNFRVWMGLIPGVLLIESKYVEHVLSSTSLTYKYDIYNMLYPWLGKGLVTSNDQLWASRRKLITPSFHFRILKDFLYIINETCDRFMVLLEQESAKAEHQMVDIQELVGRSTIDIICETAMGTRVNSIEGNPSPIVKAIAFLSYAAAQRITAVLKRVDLFFKLTPLYRQQQQALATLRVEFEKIIEQRRLLLQTSSYQAAQVDDEELDARRPKRAFLDNLLTAEENGKPLTSQQIFEEVSTFMFAGHDTTTSAISFAIYCLAICPDVQQRAYEEQMSILESANGQERHATYQELQDMKYLDLVIKESLRVFPSVPLIFRTLREPTVIVDKFIPANTTIILPMLAMGHSPHSFDKPFEFRPERFEADQRTENNAFDYVPFSAGPRNCIGQKFAQLEVKVTLSKILRKFKLLPAPLAKQSIAQAFQPEYNPGPQELKLHIPLTLKSLTGVPVCLHLRQPIKV